MTNSEKILIWTCLLAMVLKLLSIPGSGLLAVTSFSLLSMLYFPLGFATLNQIGLRKLFTKDSYQGISRGRMISTIGLGMAFSAVVIGVLFRIQRYPGAAINLVVGTTVTFLAGVVVLVRYLETKSPFYKKTLRKIIVFFIFGTIMFILTPTRISYMMHQDNPEMQQESNQ